MELWTLQHKAVLDAVEAGEAYAVSRGDTYPLGWNHPDLLMLNAYDWLVAQMEQRIGPRPEGVEYPVWAWAKQRGSASGRPDVSGKSAEARKNLVLFQLEVPEDRLVLTDFDLWHFALYCLYLPCDSADEEAFDSYLDGLGLLPSDVADFSRQDAAVLEARRKAMESWTRIVDQDIAPEMRDDAEIDRATQATFWQLLPEYVVEATPLA